MAEENEPKKKVFISYSHADSQWAERLKAHLETADSHGLVEFWTDSDIQAAENWKENISSAINSAKVIIILVSPEFISSKYMAEFELPLIQKVADEGVIVIPVMIRPTQTNGLLDKFKSIEIEPITALSPGDQQRVLINTAKMINQVILSEPIVSGNLSGKVLASAIGGAVVGNMMGFILPGIGSIIGPIVGAMIGGAVAASSKEGKHEEP